MCRFEKFCFLIKNFFPPFFLDPNHAENITHSLISEGLVSVREGVRNSKDPQLVELIALEDAAKAAKKGKWDPNADPQVNINLLVL